MGSYKIKANCEIIDTSKLSMLDKTFMNRVLHSVTKVHVDFYCVHTCMSVSGCIPFYLISWLTEMNGILGKSIHSSSGLISTKYTPNRCQGELGK